MEHHLPAGIPPIPAEQSSSESDRTLPCLPSWKTSFFMCAYTGKYIILWNFSFRHDLTEWYAQREYLGRGTL